MRRLAWLAIALFALPLLAQETEPIVLTILSAKMETVDEEFVLQLRVDSQLDDLIYKTEMRPPEELLDGRDIPNLRPDDPPVIVSPWFRDYKNDILRLRLPASTKRHLFWRSRELDGSVKLTFVAAGMKSAVSTASVAFRIKPPAPILGVMVGGVLGVIAVVLLRLVILLLRKTKKVATGDLKKALLSVVIGVFVVVIVTFLVRFAPDRFDLPIKVDVSDWIGGFILGLFFEPLAKWLAEKMNIPGMA